MKWIFWIIWSILVIGYLLLSMLGYVVMNFLAFTWNFKKKHLFSWGDWASEETIDYIKGEWVTVYYPDKNPWETYKRWSFYNDL